MDCVSLYYFCSLYLRDDTPHKYKEQPIKFNCVNQEFNYKNLVPNATIIALYNRALEKFEKQNGAYLEENRGKIFPEDYDINELFSEYLWCANRYTLPFKTFQLDKIEHNAEMHKAYMEIKARCEEIYYNDVAQYEMAFEYKTDEKGLADCQKHGKDNRTEGGLDHRAKQTLGTLTVGHRFEVWVEQELIKKHDLDIGLYYSKKDQQKGECARGLEFKCDAMGQETGNAYLEYAESRHAANKRSSGPKVKDARYSDGEGHETNKYGNTEVIDVTVPSGIAKYDNSDFMVIGVAEDFSIVRKSLLEAYALEVGAEELAQKHLGPGKRQKWFKDKDGKDFGVVIRIEEVNGKPFIASKAILVKNDRLKTDFAVGNSIDDLAKLLKEEDRRKELGLGLGINDEPMPDEIDKKQPKKARGGDAR